MALKVSFSPTPCLLPVAELEIDRLADHITPGQPWPLVGGDLKALALRRVELHQPASNPMRCSRPPLPGARYFAGEIR
jgi:hypothetical protein